MEKKYDLHLVYFQRSSVMGFSRIPILFLFTVAILIGCDSDTKDDVLDIVEGPDRGTIEVSRMGVNAFGDKAEFGSPCEQYAEVVNTLGLRFIRLLFHWNDAVQPSPSEPINFGFYDEIIGCLPPGSDALIVVEGLPSWMAAPENWSVGGNPRLTFVERWFKPVLERYGIQPRVVGFQVWNEPNMVANPDNSTLNIAVSPENYVELLAAAYSVGKDVAADKLILNAATTAIAQDYPSSLNYNRALKEAGVLQFIDVYAIHYYGKQIENVVDGVRGFLNGIPRPIWITESGAQGASKQLEYVEEIWPYLRSQISGIDRIYYYQYASSEPRDSSYGLRLSDPQFPVSDLWIYLRDQAK